MGSAQSSAAPAAAATTTSFGEAATDDDRIAAALAADEQPDDEVHEGGRTLPSTQQLREMHKGASPPPSSLRDADMDVLRFEDGARPNKSETKLTHHDGGDRSPPRVCASAR